MTAIVLTSDNPPVKILINPQHVIFARESTPGTFEIHGVGGTVLTFTGQGFSKDLIEQIGAALNKA